MADNIPINKGVEDLVYACVKEAGKIGNPDFKSQAHQLEIDDESMISPLFQAGGIKDRAIALAASMAEASGRPNCLYQPDSIVDTTGGTQTAFQDGDLSANVAAAGADIASTVKEEAAGAVDLGTKGLKYAVYALLGLAVLYVVLKARR